MNNTMIHFAAREAARKFGGGDGTFNLAGFSLALRRLAGQHGGMDGVLCRAILTGQPGIEVLPGGAHYRVDPK